MDYLYFDGEDLNVAEEHRRRVLHQMFLRRELRDNNDPFRISTPEFIKLYRMPQHHVKAIVEIIRPYVPEGQRNTYIPLELRVKFIEVLCSIALYAAGLYQRHHGRISDVSMSQAMVSKCFEEVTEALNHPDMLRRFIRFPVTHEDREVTINRISALGMPRTLGYIDGTLVKIVPPRDNPQAYRCRKGFTSLNVQIVCDANLYIMNVNSRYPGSCTDPYIYGVSPVQNAMRTAFEETRCWLLGDSAYPLQPWLQVPILNTVPGTPEYYFTKLHCHCRNAVERCIGVLKERFRCLLCDRTLHYHPEKEGRVVNACVVLHNYLREVNAPLPGAAYENNENNVFGNEDDFEQDLQLVHLAAEVRNYLVDYSYQRWLQMHDEE